MCCPNELPVTKIALFIFDSFKHSWKYQGPLRQAVEAGVQVRCKHVQVKGVNEALQPITGFMESVRHTAQCLQLFHTPLSINGNGLFLILLTTEGFTVQSTDSDAHDCRLKPHLWVCCCANILIDAVSRFAIACCPYSSLETISLFFALDLGRVFSCHRVDRVAMSTPQSCTLLLFLFFSH